MKYLNKYPNTLTPQVVRATSISTSAAVTAYGRIHITDLKLKIMKLGGKIWYSDTDSIVTDIRLPADMVDLSSLGKLKLEHENIRKAIFISGKTYCLVKEDGTVLSIAKGAARNSISYEQYVELLNKKDIKTFKTVSTKSWWKGVDIHNIPINLQADAYNSRKKIYNENKLWVDTASCIISKVICPVKTGMELVLYKKPLLYNGLKLTSNYIPTVFSVKNSTSMNSNSSKYFSRISNSFMGYRKYISAFNSGISNLKMILLLGFSGLAYLWIKGDPEEDLFDNIELEDPPINVNESNISMMKSDNENSLRDIITDNKEISIMLKPDSEKSLLDITDTEEKERFKMYIVNDRQDLAFIKQFMGNSCSPCQKQVLEELGLFIDVSDPKNIHLPKEYLQQDHTLALHDNVSHRRGIDTIDVEQPKTPITAIRIIPSVTDENPSASVTDGNPSPSVTDEKPFRILLGPITANQNLINLYNEMGLANQSLPEKNLTNYTAEQLLDELDKTKETLHSISEVDGDEETKEKVENSLRGYEKHLLTQWNSYLKGMTKSTVERLENPNYVEPNYMAEIISESRDYGGVAVQSENPSTNTSVNSEIKDKGLQESLLKTTEDVTNTDNKSNRVMVWLGKLVIGFKYIKVNISILNMLGMNIPPHTNQSTLFKNYKDMNKLEDDEEVAPLSN